MEVEFGKGLNILTGETGAGKSLLMGAIGLAQGKRADSIQVGKNSQKCIVELVFKFDPASKRLSVFHSAEWYDSDCEEQLVIRREISLSGKSRAFINDTPVKLDELKQLAEELIDLHGQHEDQKIVDTAKQISILDQYAGLEDKVKVYKNFLNKYLNIKKQIFSLREKESEAKRRSDYLAFQINELKTANLVDGEEEALEQELKILHSAEQLGETLQLSLEVLDRGEESVCGRLVNIERKLQKITSIHKNIEEETAKLNQARILIEDAAAELERIGESIENNPSRLSYIEERLSILHRLKTKFAASSVSELIGLLNQFREEYAKTEQLEEEINNLQFELKQMEDDMVPLALEIEEQRKKAALVLASEIEKILHEVGLNKGTFRIDVSRLHKEGVEVESGIWINQNGINHVEFLIQTNPGQPIEPLHSIASGGEVSRIMLALKAALAHRIQPAVLIFDEIDTGISGEIALKVGHVMDRLSETHQMIVITHLPQIASRGTKHFKIYKEVIDQNTYSRIKELQPEERIHEIAVIMSGEHPTANTLQSAWELLNLGKRSA
jgi:DNA repair protein RecN (Recombination protein N)